MEISNFITKEKTVEVEFPGCEGFKVKLAYLSREELQKIRNKCLTTTIDRKTRQPKQELNEDLFLKSYIPLVLKDWSGFKLKYLTELTPVDFPEDQDLEVEVEYTEKNAITLMTNSTIFDAWLSEVISDVANFNKSS